MFESCGFKQLLLAALDGFSATCFAYGQTGSGKTFTVVGAENVHGWINIAYYFIKFGELLPDILDQRSSEGDGAIPRAMKYIFKEIERRKDKSYTVETSYFEIYNEQVDPFFGGCSQCAAGA